MVYYIPDWDDTFEKAQSRKATTLSWVAVPNKHDGKSYRRVCRLPRAAEIFCAWNLMLQVASKQEQRGILMDEDGPMVAEDLADMTGYPSEIFDLAFVSLTNIKIGWLIKCTTSELPVVSERDTLTGQNKQDKHTYTYSPEFISFWAVYPRKIDKGHAFKAFKRVIDQGVVDTTTLIVAANKYRDATQGTEMRYIKHAQTWINGGCWDDEHQPTQRKENIL